MASRGTEGRREIEAAKKRLAAATAQASSAAKNAEAAKEMQTSAWRVMMAVTMNYMGTVNHAVAAESQVQSTQKEVDEAKKFLKEAEQRWEVIDVDAADESGSKRRKVSLSPEPSSDDATNGQEVDRIVVKGCGDPKASGIYKRDGERKGAPRFTRSVGAFVYIIHRGYGETDWFIARRRAQQIGIEHLYGSFSSSGNVLPPKSGWWVCDGGGALPAPELNW